MHVLLRRLGEHRGSPRLYLDTTALAAAGFVPGVAIDFTVGTSEEARLTIRVASDGKRKVSRKRRGHQVVPVIDINSSHDLQPFVAGGAVRVVIEIGAVHVLMPASVRKALARSARLVARIALGQPLRTAGIAFGAGIASGALHAGLTAGGVASELALANEIAEEYLDIARRSNPVVGPKTTTAAMPMQELAQDDWLLRRVQTVEILEAGIPCSGASRAGAAKRGLTRMEDHPHVGHLIGAALQVIAALQPAILVMENVETYRNTASASILRAWLRDAGYTVAETVLSARDFGSLEARVRWFLVAYPPELPLDLENLAPAEPDRPCLGDFLEPIAQDDERYRRVDYLKAKQERDAESGKGFGMQLLTPASQLVPVLRKGYHKGGSPDPRLLHPTDAERSRLLTAAEHARIKGISPRLVDGMPETTAHQVCGQSVDVRPVQAIGLRVAQALTALGRSRDGAQGGTIQSVAGFAAVA
ncbi:putative DNA (cytosine-5-)-methyltransferase [Rubrivivax sp. A210]|uniref:DNA cytosine methyltransferase n=1 Tax=Rubrivivax sp. A210 TaxID=2772301 RepID=UPI0019191FA2|nr:DNA cytosine methyltransferase [Rubrivivax sp. A210]CAD5366685.1 putative DNA (cytosine-5-)-methyltransferase [Rubrivivax sp. A210]